MKKGLLIISILASSSLFAYTAISDVSTWWDDAILDKEIKRLSINKFNYSEDIAVVSGKYNINFINFRENAHKDALNGIYKYSKDYAEQLLNNYLSQSLLSGPGYDSYKMAEIADVITSEIIENKKYSLVGEWTEGDKLFVIYKIEKKTVKEITDKYFYERLSLVTDKLNEFKNDFYKNNNIR